MRLVGGLPEQGQRAGRLVDPSRPSEEDQLARQDGPEDGFQRAAPDTREMEPAPLYS